jgi:hypothetical protein
LAQALVTRTWLTVPARRVSRALSQRSRRFRDLITSLRVALPGEEEKDYEEEIDALIRPAPGSPTRSPPSPKGGAAGLGLQIIAPAH